MFIDLLQKTKAVSLVGLGYVGLPLALLMAKKFRVIGFDINERRINQMKLGIDPSQELDSVKFRGRDIMFTTDPQDLREADFHIIAVPTPIDKYKVPNLQPLFNASKTVGKILKPGDYVLYESTVYPGCTDEECVPILEKASGLRAGVDFNYGFSPERINPGDKEHTVEKILKVVSGNNSDSLDEIAKIYGSVIMAGVYKASTIKVAEAAKVIENAQRDINIAFMNELAVIFDKLGIDTKEVLEAAGTKWNFLKFFPGLVGGHCIGVDPYYLTYKAQQIGYNPRVILSGRAINDGMPSFIAKKLVQMLTKGGVNPARSKVLVMGITFKENVSDIRNSKVEELINELKSYQIDCSVDDPHAVEEEVMDEYGIQLHGIGSGPYDAIIVAVGHNKYKKLSAEFFQDRLQSQGILMDLKGIYEQDFIAQRYWRL